MTTSVPSQAGISGFLGLFGLSDTPRCVFPNTWKPLSFNQYEGLAHSFLYFILGLKGLKERHRKIRIALQKFKFHKARNTLGLIWLWAKPSSCGDVQSVAFYIVTSSIAFGLAAMCEALLHLLHRFRCRHT
jgi:hypothetical protein